MIKVLHIASSTIESSAYTSLFSNLKDGDGIKQQCIVPWPVNESTPQNIPVNTEIVKCKYNMLYGQYFLKVYLMFNIINRHVRKNSLSFDLIHGHYVFYDGDMAYKLSKSSKKPFIISFRNSDLFFFKKRSYLRKRGLKILKAASKIIFISHAHYNEFFNNFLQVNLKNELAKKSIVLPNGIDSYWQKNVFKDKVIALNNPINILTVGWIQKNKNQLSVAEVINKLSQNIKDKITYTVIGHIRDKSYYEKVAKFSFVKYVEPVPKEKLLMYYRNSDIFVMPSYKETFGLVFLEALSQKLPIIYTKNQGIDGFFPQGKYGYAVNPADTDDIYDKLYTIIKDYSNFNFYDINKFEQFNWIEIAKKHKNIYESIVNETDYKC